MRPMDSPNDIRAVYWDLGGVILRTHDQSRRERWEKRLGLKRYGLAELVFEGEMGRLASVGKSSPDEVWVWVAEQLGIEQDQRWKLEKDFWAGDRVDRDLVDFIRNLRPHYKTGLISNAWPDLRNAMENEWEIVSAFDDLVISAEIGITKPDPRIYQLALTRLDVAAEEAVFIDDFERNVEGARAVGLHGIHFQNPHQVKQDLRTLLGL
jgi:HAD superfamily hydrolase (TIGR01509 family)